MEHEIFACNGSCSALTPRGNFRRVPGGLCKNRPGWWSEGDLNPRDPSESTRSPRAIEPALDPRHSPDAAVTDRASRFDLVARPTATRLHLFEIRDHLTPEQTNRVHNPHMREITHLRKA